MKTTENYEPLPVDQRQFVYDISFVLDNKTDALYVAENGKQDAIFDISAGQTIDTAPAVRDLRASGLYTPSDRGRLQELGGKVDYLAGRKGSLRTAVESVRRAVNPAVQARRIQSQGRSLQEAGSPEVVASTRGAVSVESVPLRRDGVRIEKPSVKEVATFLQQRSIERIQEPLTKDTPADVRMAQFLVNIWPETSYQLQQEDAGMTWYSADIEQMESDLNQLYPESIGNRKERMVLIKAMMVANSFSQNPKQETLSTMRIWEASKQQFPVMPRQKNGKGWTVRGKIVEIYMERINKLVADKGEKGAADWLLSKHTVKELREYNENVKGKQSDIKYGSYILGRKGGSYHLNMNGIYDVLTVDLHFSRMWNRMMGTVFDKNGEIIQAPTDAEYDIQEQAVRFAANKLGLSVAELQAVSWVYEIGLWKELGAKIEYYKHSNGTDKLLKDRGLQRREIVQDLRAAEERRQTALSRSNALRDGRDPQQVLPEEVRASTRGAQPRNEVIQQAANDFFEGRISREELNRISEEQKPARPVTSIPILTDDEARSSLDAGKQGMYGVARTLEEGTPVGLRIDIPSYNRTGNYVVTVHNQAEGKSRVGKVIGYDRIAAVKDARFFNASEKVTLSIAQGYSKTPLATVEGKYIPMANAPAGLLENYQQVGFDPQRHSYFYNKENGNPVVSADEAILIGNTAFVKGAVEGNRGDFLFSTRGEQARQILEPVISFGRQQLRTGGALPYDIFRMTEQRGFNVNEKMLRAQNAVSDIEAAVKRSYGKSLDQLPEVEIARINEGLQNPLARAKLPTDVASAVGNARNLIDSLTQDLLRSGAISEDLKPVLEANKGVYLNRSYEKWENPNYKNPFNTLPKQVQNKLVTTVTSYLHNKYANAYAKEQSLARGEVAINPNSGTYQADYQAGLTKARSGGVTKAEVDGQIEYLASPETDSPFGQIGSGLTKDLSIITARKNIPEEIRMLWGEIKDPRVNFLKSVQKMSGFLEAHNMLKGMRDAGMNKIFFATPRTGFTTKLVSDGSRTASPLNMFIDGMSNDVYTSEEIATALRNTFGGRAKAQDFLGKMGELYLKANGFSKFAKTVLSVQTQVRNLLGNGSFLVANGYIFSPDGITALNKLKTLALPSAGTQLGINKSKEFRDYNAKLTRLGILGQSVFANEMESYFKDANVSTAADFLDNHVTKGLKAIGRGATNLYQLGDAIPKIVAFEVELSRLRKAYPTQPLSKLEPMAADKVLNLLPTYSRIPRLGNVLRSQPFVGAFISFPLEVVRTGYNLLGTINDELRSDNPAIRQAGAYRLAGTMMASIGFSAVAAGIASAMGIDDDEDQAIRKLDAPWDKYATKLYLGRDDKGNVNQVNLSYVDPYNYFRDPIIALMKMDGTWDQKLLESVKTAFQPLYGEQILASKILDISRNTKGTTGGRVYNPEADLASRAAAVSAHMFDAFNIGTVVSSVRVYRGLTGQVTQTGRAYDPALETIATLTGQRVVTLDPRQSLGFTARKFSNRLNDATGIFTAAYYDRSNVSNEARLEAYRQMRSSRKEIFNETSGIISAAMKLGVSRGEVMRILKEQGVSMDNARALLSGNVAVYKPAKREMKGDAIRFGQQVYAEQ